MALPRIPSYPLPPAASFPRSRVDWRPDPDRAVLLVHDMQRYFLEPYGPRAEPIAGVVAAIAALLRTCRDVGIPVVYTAQPGRQSAAERGLLTDMWGLGIGGVIGDRPDAEAIVDELAPEPGDVRLVKWRYSAFQRSDLADRMAAWGRDQLVVTGIYASIGCLTTAVEAFMLDIEPFLVGDAVADFSAEDHEQALRHVARRCGVVLGADQVCDTLARARPVLRSAT